MLFFLGASIGSFICVLLETGRTKNRKHLFWGRSCCESCKRKLLWHELIPVISYIKNRWTCSSCSSRIPSWYLITELVFGFFTVLAVAYLYGWIFLTFSEVLFRLVIVRVFLAISVSDIMWYELPIYPWVFGVFWTIGGYLLLPYWTGVLETGWIFVVVCWAISAVLYALGKYLVYRKTGSREEWFGLGDVLLMCRIGTLFPLMFTDLMLLPHWLRVLMQIQIVFLRLILASSLGILRRVIQRNQHIPFLPLLIISFVSLCLFWGEIQEFLLAFLI